MSKTSPFQLESIEEDLNNTAQKLCLQSLNVQLSNEDIRTPTVTWSWGWSIDVGYERNSLGSRYRCGSNDSYIGSSHETANYVKELVTLYANYKNRYFVDKLGNELPESELDNFNLGSITLGSTGVFYISSDICSSCNGNGKEECIVCYGRGEKGCEKCYGTGSIEELVHEWAPKNQGVSRYVQRKCTSCHGSCHTTCYQCNGSGNVTCRSCGGSGEHYYSYTIFANSNKHVTWSWDGGQTHNWLPEVLKKYVNNGGTPAITPFLTQCEPAMLEQPIKGCAYSYSMTSIIPCAEYSALANNEGTSVNVIGPEQHICNAGAILDFPAWDIGRNIAKGSIEDNEVLINTPVIDLLLKSYDDEHEHLLRKENYISKKTYHAITEKYDVLVGQLKRQRKGVFWTRFCKYSTVWSFIIGLVLASFCLVYPEYRWRGGELVNYIKDISATTDYITGVYADMYLKNTERALVSTGCAVFLVGLIKFLYWRSIGWWQAIFRYIAASIFVILYWDSLVEFSERLSFESFVNPLVGISNFTPNPLLIMMPELLLTAALLGVVQAKYASASATKKLVAELNSVTLYKRMGL